jgi:hypothetical protein
MTKQFPNDWQSLTHGHSVRSERVTEIVNTNIAQFGGRPDTTPRLLHVTEVLTVDVTNDDIGVADDPGRSL